MPLIENDTTKTYYDRLFVILLLIIVVFVSLVFRDYGYSWDETWQNRWYGQAVLSFLTTLGADLSATNTHNFYLYGGTFDVAAELLVEFSPLEPRNARHLANALAGLAGIIGCWAVARRLGSSRSGLWATLFLVVCAPYYGHMFINAKDIPFAAGYIWSLYFLIRTLESLPKPRLKVLIALGLTLGLTLGVRIGGVLIIFYLLVFVLIFLFRRWLSQKDDRALLPGYIIRLTLAVLTVTGLAWLVMLAFWPAALLQPLAIPFEAISATSHFNWVGELLWNGQVIWSDDLPWNYLPVIFAVQLPEILTLLFTTSLLWGLFLCVRGWREHLFVENTPRTGLLLIAILFPVVWAIVMHSTIYDNGRHFLFVLPPLACLAALFWALLLDKAEARKKGVALLLQLLMICALLLPVTRMAALHPYEYAYLNIFAGGMPEGAHRFDTEYWISSYREASFALVEHAEAAAAAAGRQFSETRFTVVVVGPQEALEEALPDNFVIASYEPDLRADYLVATTRWKADQRWPDWQEIAVVERLGMRFAVVKAAPGLVQLVNSGGLE